MRISDTAIVTAPAKAATNVLAQFVGERYRFMAPDALLSSSAIADWLIVSEAAATPAPLLHQLVARFPCMLSTTTVQGYKGTGRGFLLKFCARLPNLQRYELQQPVRQVQGCPLEQIVSDALMFDDETFTHAPLGEFHFLAFEQQSWHTNPALPLAVYQLLSGAYYRTSPLDLRRMMDASGQYFLQASTAGSVAGAVWLVDEGGLSAELNQTVWAGYRRPRENLVAQSLVVYGGDPLAATLVGRRVSQIAVHPARQREGIGQWLIMLAYRYSTSCDYLSVSFRCTAELWRFRQRCGFVLVRMGNHREANNDCYIAMALFPISEAGKRPAERELLRLRHDAEILARRNGESIPLVPLKETTLNEDDWAELTEFVFAHRPLLTLLGCLSRLLEHSELPLPALRGHIQAKRSDAGLCQQLRISGRKVLLIVQRAEATQALNQSDAEREQRLHNRIMRWQFSH